MRWRGPSREGGFFSPSARPASRKAETILFLHSTSRVRNILTLLANALYVGRVVT
jgi:hypothetical protein